MTVTESLKRFRKENKIIQKEIAVLLGIKTQMYQYYESNGGLSIINLKKIAEHYKVAADYLLGLSDDPTPAKSANRAEDIRSLKAQLAELAAKIDKLG